MHAWLNKERYLQWIQLRLSRVKLELSEALHVSKPYAAQVRAGPTPTASETLGGWRSWLVILIELNWRNENHSRLADCQSRTLYRPPEDPVPSASVLTRSRCLRSY